MPLAAHRRGNDAGIATPVEMMYLLVFCLAVVAFLGFVGRLHAAGVQVANAAQSAARSASMAPDPNAAQAAALAAVDVYGLQTRCVGGPTVVMSWDPSPSGSWQGGSVTVDVSCTVRNQSLTGVWSPGSRTVAMTDTQPIDRYQR
ncbi:MAG: hypothetical protein K8R99_01455 [Actinomycetia bacterium]|nr:hypothetical protein [Actinomycetes bacterium]